MLNLCYFLFFILRLCRFQISLPQVTPPRSAKKMVNSLMDRFSLDLLHLVLRWVTSVDVLIARRVCKSWLETIDEHKSFWRALDLSPGSSKHGSSFANLFDRKSESDIRDVQIDWRNKESQDINDVLQTLQKSKFKLRSFYLDVLYAENLGIYPSQFPKLQDFRLLNSHTFGLPVVLLVDESLNSREGLRVLWKPLLFDSDHVYFRNLTSLAIEISRTSIEWREILEGRLSNQLKDLRLKVCQGPLGEEGLTPLNFPRLKVLELQSQYNYPGWLGVPFDSVLVINQDTFMSGTPNVAHLWLNLSRLEGWQSINALYPSVATLSIQSEFPFVHLLPFLLRQRRIKVEDGVEIGGIRMTPIGALLVDFDHFTEEELVFFGTFVGEMIDSKKISNFINVAI